MNSRRVLRLPSLVLIVALVIAGCRKKSVAPAADSLADPWAASTGPLDPWAGPPPGAVAIAAGDGDALAEMTVANDKPAAPTPRGSAGFRQIAAPVEETLEMRSFGSIKQTGFSVTYNPSTIEAHENYRKLLEANRVFEKFAEGLNKTIRIPNQIDIQLVDCKAVNAFYDPNGKRIIICYELIDYFLRVFKPVAKDNDELGSAVFGAVAFSFFHEVGHSLIDQLELPAVGREEDSADQIATLTLIGTGDEGVGMALSGAYWFQLQQKGGNETPFWDEHAFDGQRFYNIVCLIYGSDPDKYGKFVDSGTLPANRAKRCPEEYAKIGKAWNKLLANHLTNSGAKNTDLPTAVAVVDPPVVAPQHPIGAASDTEHSEDPDQGPQPAVASNQAHSISCEQVAEKAAELIGAEFEERARAMSEQELVEAKQRVETELPAALETILAQCRKDDWADVSRLCVINAASLPEASSCE
jgi:Putative metallopeptidase